MDRTPLPDLNTLDRDASLALLRAQQDEQEKLNEERKRLDTMLRDREEELRQLEAELESSQHAISAQADELRSRSERIERLKLMVEKYRHMLFGAKSEKIVVKLEQLEFELEEPSPNASRRVKK
jgi:DNA repair ATPase RecN